MEAPEREERFEEEEGKCEEITVKNTSQIWWKAWIHKSKMFIELQYVEVKEIHTENHTV